MSLTVVTHTRFNRNELLTRCVESVHRALPPGARHLIVPCYGNFAEMRVDALRYDEFIAFVDDDDTIDPDGLKWCMQAHASANVGVVCTNEAVTDANGTIIRYCNNNKRYEAMCLSPRVLHHLCVFRSTAVDPIVLDMHRKFTVGIDWFMRVSAAARHGALHIPKTGYFWYNVGNQNNLSRATDDMYRQHLAGMADMMKQTWKIPSGQIPIFNPE